MKKLFGALLALVSSVALATTTVPVQLLNPAGSSSGQTIVSTGASSAPGWATIPLSGLTSIAANTVLANATSASAAPAAFAMPSCSTGSSALNYTTNTGIGCNTSINAATLGGATFAAPGPIGSTTASTGAFTTLSASSTVSGTGFSTYLASPPAIGGTTAAAGTFTTLKANSAARLNYKNSSGQSIPSNTATTITGWTSVFDANSNFVAATGVFTAPSTGYYLVSGQVALNLSGTLAVNNLLQAVVLANSVAVGTFTTTITATTQTSVYVAFSMLVSLTSGQTLSIQAINVTTSSQTLAGGTYVSIAQIP